MDKPKQQHVPVMLNEVMEYLDINPDGIYVDGTLGLGGHALGILEKLNPEGLLIGIDRDASALALAQQRLSSYSNQCKFVHSDYRKIDNVLDELGVEKVDGILLDLGISSFQIDNPERGFSLRADGPLDMRMDQESYISAYDLINSLSEKEIDAILKNFGQERWHHRIAHLLVTQRQKNPIETTRELRHIVMRAMPNGRKRTKIHPATRTFQAFRIAVNRELEALEIALDKAIDLLKPKGRLCIISFHSLEDRIAKNKFKAYAKSGILNLIFKKPLKSNYKDISTNPRSRSARLRVAERV